MSRQGIGYRLATFLLQTALYVGDKRGTDNRISQL